MIRARAVSLHRSASFLRFSNVLSASAVQTNLGIVRLLSGLGRGTSSCRNSLNLQKNATGVRGIPVCFPICSHSSRQSSPCALSSSNKLSYLSIHGTRIRLGIKGTRASASNIVTTSSSSASAPFRVSLSDAVGVCFGTFSASAFNPADELLSVVSIQPLFIYLLWQGIQRPGKSQYVSQFPVLTSFHFIFSDRNFINNSSSSCVHARHARETTTASPSAFQTLGYRRTFCKSQS